MFALEFTEIFLLPRDASISASIDLNCVVRGKHTDLVVSFREFVHLVRTEEAEVAKLQCSTERPYEHPQECSPDAERSRGHVAPQEAFDPLASLTFKAAAHDLLLHICRLRNIGVGNGLPGYLAVCSLRQLRAWTRKHDHAPWSDHGWHSCNTSASFLTGYGLVQKLFCPGQCVSEAMRINMHTLEHQRRRTAA